MKLLSIVIPFFNTSESLFAKCLASLRCDRAGDIEVVVVDDGSSPESGRTLEKVVSAAPIDVSVLHKENGGQNSARVHGLSIARGEYVLFIDSDDYVDTGALDDLLDILEREKPKILSFNYDVVDAGGGLIERHDRWRGGCSTMDIAEGVIHSDSLWMQAYRKELISDSESLFAQGIRIGEDLASATRILLAVGEASTAGISLYRYVKRPGSTLDKPPSDSMLDIARAFDWILGLPEGKVSPYRSELEWMAILHVLFWGGVRIISSYGPDTELKETLFDWMDDRFPDWRVNPYLKSERIASKLDFRLVVFGRWRECRRLHGVKRLAKHLLGTVGS